MIDSAELKRVFADKLHQTGSLDAAILKMGWVAYQQGVNDNNRLVVGDITIQPLENGGFWLQHVSGEGGEFKDFKAAVELFYRREF